MRVKNFWPGMSQMGEPPALPVVSHRAMGARARTLRPEEGWTMMQTASIAASARPPTTSGCLSG